jgi:hypothetical protein
MPTRDNCAVHTDTGGQRWIIRRNRTPGSSSTTIHPYAAKQQALPYAQQLGAPFIFLTNGEA